jgi:hypothetical protein
MKQACLIAGVLFLPALTFAAQGTWIGENDSKPPSLVLHPSIEKSAPWVPAPLPWSSNAKLHRLPRAQDGRLTISSSGVEFRPEKGEATRWSVEDIRTVDLANPRHLSLVAYQNNRWHLPGDRPFVFTLQTPMPPEIAADLVREVAKPAINGDPPKEAGSFDTIAARHVTRMGGSNGELRFTSSGIEYLSKAGDARSWRWADIQTLAHPEPYRFRVGGFLETFDFELKQPLTSAVFDRLWNHIYAQGLNLGTPFGGNDE